MFFQRLQEQSSPGTSWHRTCMPASPFHADLCLTQHGQQTMLFNSFKNRICQDPHEDPSPLPPQTGQQKHVFSKVSRTESAGTLWDPCLVYTSRFDARLMHVFQKFQEQNLPGPSWGPLSTHPLSTLSFAFPHRPANPCFPDSKTTFARNLIKACVCTFWCWPKVSQENLMTWDLCPRTRFEVDLSPDARPANLWLLKVSRTRSARNFMT